MTADEPGWYADPRGTAPQRWWDGERWTRWLTDDPQAAAPGVAPTRTDQGPGARAGSGAASDTGAEAASDTRAEATVAPEPEPDPGMVDGPAAERLVRLPVAVAVVLGSLLLAVLGLGAVASGTATRLPGGPAVDPPAPSPPTAVVFDPATRTVSVAELQLTLAGAPYACGAGPQPLPPVFSSSEVCSTVVHRDVDGQGSDWSATTGVGLLAEELAVPGDVEQTGDRVFEALRSRFFAGEETTVAHLTSRPSGLTPDGRSTTVVGEVRYRVAGVPSRYDRVVVVVVALADGTHAAWFSARPERTPTATLEVLDASIATLHVR